MNPLATSTRLAEAAWVLSAVAFVIHVVALVSGLSEEEHVCFETSATGFLHVAEQTKEYLRPDVFTSARVQNLCVTEPTGGDRALGALQMLPGMLGYAVLFFLLKKLLDHVAGHGFHTAATADRLRRFGWCLSTVLPVVTLVEAVARRQLLHRVLTPEAVDHYLVGSYGFLTDWDYPLWSLVTGMCVLASAKVVRSSAGARERVEATD